LATELVCDRDWEVLQLTLQRFAVLCYERDSAVAGFYETDGANGIQHLQEYSGWRQSWTFIVPGVFGDSGYDGLLLYDQQAGFGAI